MSTTKIAPVLSLNVVEIMDETDSPSAGAVKSLQYSNWDARDTQFDVEGGHPPMAAELAGGDTLDLTAAPLARDAAVNYDYTGAKVIGFLIQADSANGANITVEPGATNPYDIGTHLLSPGQVTCVRGFVGDDVAAGAKEIDITGDPGDIVQILAILEEETS